MALLLLLLLLLLLVQTTHFAENAAEEVVVAGEVVNEQPCLWVGVQQFVRRAAEEPTVWVERRLDQLRHELAEDAATVDTGLVKTSKIHQSNLHPQLQVRLCTPSTQQSIGSL